MGVFGRFFGTVPVAGTHPDSAIRTTERGEAHRYVATRYECPVCRRKGSKEVRGHAMVLRLQPNGEAHAYDVFNVFCGCGKFSAFWSDSTKWNIAMADVAREMCKPDGKCRWISGSGHMPGLDPSVLAQDW